MPTFFVFPRCTCIVWTKPSANVVSALMYSTTGSWTSMTSTVTAHHVALRDDSAWRTRHVQQSETWPASFRSITAAVMYNLSSDAGRLGNLNVSLTSDLSRTSGTTERITAAEHLVGVNQMSNPRQTTPASTYPAKHTSTRTLVSTSLTARGMPVFARSVFVCPCLTAEY